MKLYHITLEVGQEKKAFTPRTVISMRDDEDATVKRVCLSDSIENCLNLVAWAENNEIEELFTEYSEHEKTVPIRVYEFEINVDDVNLIHPSQVHKNGVADGEAFNEYWYTGSVLTPSNSYVIYLNSEYNTKVETIYAGVNDEGYYQNEKERYLKDNPELDEDDFYESFYTFSKDVNFNISMSRCEILIPSQHSFDDKYQVFNISIDSINPLNEDDILEIFESMKCEFNEETLRMFIDVHKYGNGEFSISVDTVFFGVIKSDFEKLLAEKSAKLISA